MSKHNKSQPDPRTVGKLGSSQAVSTFGVGSIYEMRSVGKSGSLIVHSVMLSGLEFWPADLSSYIYETSLQKALRVRYFRRPPVDQSRTGGLSLAIPATRFPLTHYCSAAQCSRVGRLGMEFQDRDRGGVVCGKPGCKGKGVPFRFVTACHVQGDPAHPGHIDDFPFVWWTHSRGKMCEKPAIRLVSSTERSGLDGMILECACSARRSMAGVFAPDALSGLKCRGERPWLADREEGCIRPLRVLQRGASNLYFPVTVSALSIPPHSSRLHQLLTDALPPHFVETIRNDLERQLDVFLPIVRNMPGLDDDARFSDGQIRDGIRALVGAETGGSAVQTMAEQKQLEQNALLAGSEEAEDDFEARAVSLDGAEFSAWVSDLVQVHRLREVRATKGFQRVEPGYGGDPYRIECAPLFKKPTNWLPAIEVRGEGIYVGLDGGSVAAWQESPFVSQRIAVLNRNLRAASAAAGRDVPDDVSPRFVLVHTLSHLLMRQLALECGYSGSSLRERLYVDEADLNRTGVLIYTASGSSDGTLGGLVSQGARESLGGILRSAVQAAWWCSSDPLCEESAAHGTDALNLAACHACALVAETSCEERNMFLDRALLVGTSDNRNVGYLSGLAEKWGIA